jgi:predicted GH43/DUF377 family glycosyl hydrolase
MNGHIVLIFLSLIVFCVLVGHYSTVSNSAKQLRGMSNWITNKPGFYDREPFNASVLATEPKWTYIARMSERSSGSFLESARYMSNNFGKNNVVVFGADNIKNSIGAGLDKDEDPRAFFFQGKPYVLVTRMLEEGRWRMVLYHLNEFIQIEKEVVIEWDGVPYESIQKNWQPFQHGDQLYLVPFHQPNHVVLKVDVNTGECHKEYETENVIHGNWRGGTPAIRIYNSEKGDVYVSVIHVKLGIMKGYRHVFYVFDGNPPFNVLGSTEPFVFDNKHFTFNYPPIIEYACGLVEKDDKLHITYGLFNNGSKEHVVMKEDVWEMVNWV